LALTNGGQALTNVGAINGFTLRQGASLSDTTKFYKNSDTVQLLAKLLKTTDSTTLFAGKLGGWIEIQRAADTTLNAANVTFVNLGELFFTMASSGVYEIQGRLFVVKTTDASAYTMALNCGGTPTSVGMVFTALMLGTDGSDSRRDGVITTGADSIQLTAATIGNGKQDFMDFRGSIINQAENNIFQFRWHQEIASSGVTIKRGSYLRYRRLY
jgi:hypothetical protein